MEKFIKKPDVPTYIAFEKGDDENSLIAVAKRVGGSEYDLPMGEHDEPIFADQDDMDAVIYSAHCGEADHMKRFTTFADLMEHMQSIGWRRL
jgi:hypothetical protein